MAIKIKSITLMQMKLEELLSMENSQLRVRAFHLRKLGEEQYLLTFCARSDDGVYFGGKMLGLQLFSLRGAGVDESGRAFITGGYGPFEFRHYINQDQKNAQWQKLERLVCFRLYFGLVVSTLKEEGFACIGRALSGCR